jgi:hypothetical protein
MTAQHIRAWKTTLGQIVEDPAKVQAAEFEIAFRRWWNQNARADWPESMFEAIMRDRMRLLGVFAELTKPVPSMISAPPVPRFAS